MGHHGWHEFEDEELEDMEYDMLPYDDDFDYDYDYDFEDYGY